MLSLRLLPSSLSLLLLLLLATHPVFAQDVHTHSDAGIDYTVPNGWSIERDGELLVLSPRGDDSVAVMMVVVQADELDAVFEEIEREFSNIVSLEDADLAMTETEIGGMPAAMMSGSVSLEGERAELLVGVVLTPKSKFLVLFGIGEPTGVEEHQDALTTIIGSLTPAE